VNSQSNGKKLVARLKRYVINTRPNSISLDEFMHFFRMHADFFLLNNLITDTNGTFIGRQRRPKQITRTDPEIRLMQTEVPTLLQGVSHRCITIFCIFIIIVALLSPNIVSGGFKSIREH
jgi:hypothetical protein